MPLTSPWRCGHPCIMTWVKNLNRCMASSMKRRGGLEETLIFIFLCIIWRDSTDLLVSDSGLVPAHWDATCITKLQTCFADALLYSDASGLASVTLQKKLQHAPPGLLQSRDPKASKPQGPVSSHVSRLKLNSFEVYSTKSPQTQFQFQSINHSPSVSLSLKSLVQDSNGAPTATAMMIFWVKVSAVWDQIQLSIITQWQTGHHSEILTCYLVIWDPHWLLVFIKMATQICKTNLPFATS